MSFTIQKKLKTRLKVSLALCFGLYLMLSTALYLLQEKLIFLPNELSQNYQYEFTQPFDEVFLNPEKDVSINAIHFKATNPKGILLYFHGNAGDLSRWGKIAEYFVTLNYDVFVMDYRTYGKSKGNLSEQALYSDAQYCYEYLKKVYSENDILIYGRSLGTGIAAHLAKNNQPKNIVLETPYYSLLDIAKYRFPIFPVSTFLKYKLPTYEYIGDIDCKVLIIHGTADKVVPFASGQKLFDMGYSNVEFVGIENGGHNNLAEFDLYHSTIEKWLQ
jgi:pimeloyl-ACP methyl ester carboxylesterase